MEKPALIGTQCPFGVLLPGVWPNNIGLAINSRITSNIIFLFIVLS